jgi:2-C-methyl-D-erythritol 4-phosphate cytidylyltransferase
MNTVAIIPAAGAGLRMGLDTPKQFLALESVPIFIHTLRKFAASDAVDEILLGVRPADLDRARQELERERLTKPWRLVTGGASRQQTVAIALAQAPSSTEIAVVHDAVRPFVTLEQIQNVLNAARQTGAAILGIPSVDTVKQVERQIVIGTIPRERIVLAQTPQAFRYTLLTEAVTRAAQDGFMASDESSLVERLGQEVTVLMGSERNIKITKPSDLPLARLYIAQERDLAQRAGCSPSDG